MSGDACRGHRAGAVRQGLLRYSPRGPWACDVTKEYSRGTPPMGTVRGYRKGTSLLWVRRSTAERPSPLRVCSGLSSNALNGSVPSWLSALINLESLCVPPFCQRRLCVRLMLGRIGRLCSERAACRGVACRGHRAGSGAAAGLLRCSQRGPRARHVTEEYSRGTPPMGTVRGYRRGTWLRWVRRSTARAAESAPGVQMPQEQHADDGECAELALRAHQS
jgi:hypothetical protein